MRAPPDEAWLRAFVEPILDALERLHRAGVFHRDISPDNILLLPNGRPILLDFGSARRVVGRGTQSLTAVLKPNFAPVEQYGDEAGGMPQGPWTDLYALGATVHFMLTGRAPTPAVMRAVRDCCRRSPAGRLDDSGRPREVPRGHRLDLGGGARRAAAERALGAARAERRDGAAAAAAGADRGRRPGRRGGARCAGGHGAEARSVAGRRCAARGGAS